MTAIETREDRPQALEPTRGDALVLMFERLATNPDVDVTKLEKLIEMQERILRHNAKAEYYAAFAEMQGELPEITERGEISVNGQVRSHYAKNEDIQAALKPILKKYGFMLSFRTEFPSPTTVKVLGILAHRGGHAEQTEFLSSADTSGSKNAIQALGSSQSYGQRYTTKALLNITSRGEDDDGAAVGRHDKQLQKAPPKGYDNWFTDMEIVAEQGLGPLQKAWDASRADYRRYLTDTDKPTWEGLKRKAALVKAVQ